MNDSNWGKGNGIILNMNGYIIYKTEYKMASNFIAKTVNKNITKNRKTN